MRCCNRMRAWCLVAVLLCGAAAPAFGQDIIGEDGALEGPTPSLRFTDTVAPVRQWLIEANHNFFRLSDGSSPRLTILANGSRVGFGTASPVGPYHFVGGPFNGRFVQFSQNQDGTMAGNRTMTVGFENAATANLSNAAGFDFVLKTDGGNPRTAGRISARFHDISDASRLAALEFGVADSNTFVTSMIVTPGGVSIATPTLSHPLRVLNATCDGAVWTDASSRTLKHNIAELSMEAARATVMALQPVTYVYNNRPEDPSVGFIAEDVPELVATPDRMGLNSLEIVAALTKVVQEQEREIETLRGELRAERESLSAVLERLSALESRE